MHKYDEQPATFAASYDIVGCPTGFAGDLPAGGAKNYRRNWLPYTGLSLDSLLNDPVWIQNVKRTIYVALRPHRYWPRRARYYLRKAVAACTSHSPWEKRVLAASASQEVRHAA